MFKKVFLLPFYLLFSILSFGNNGQVILINQTQKNIEVKNNVLYLEDPSGLLSINQIIKRDDFKTIESDIPNFGVSASAFWLKLDIQNLTAISNFLIQVSQPGLDEIEFYKIAENDSITVSKMGEYIPFFNREIKDPDYIFNLNIKPLTTATFYFRVKARDNIQVPISIGTSENISYSNKNKDTIVGFYLGIMMVMLIYNIFLYITVRDKAYLLYVIYIGFVILTQASIHGYTFQILWPNLPLLAQYSSFIFPSLVAISSIYFMREFLNTKYYQPKFDKGFVFFIAAYILSSSFSVFGYFKTSFILIEICASAVSAYMLYVAFLISKMGYRPARFFLLAWSIFLIGVAIYVMKDIGVLPFNNFTLYTMPIGSAIEVVLLSFALADRINILKKEKEQSQAEALEALKQNKKLIQEQNVMLERKVEERTLELQEANSELSVTLSDLKEAQAQLVNAEKMASLGQLTAGIAHEINNPINFVSANIKPLQLDIQDLLDIISQYETINTETDLTPQLDKIKAFKEEIDIGYVTNEIRVLLGGIEDGAKRTAEIVKGLKNFSRLDETDIKGADINEGIESTLLLLRNSISNLIHIEMHLGQIPSIQCYPGKLNQVFMNVLNNAIQAMDKRKTEENHVLSISTALENDYVVVTIEDTGIGMSSAVKEKIFEPFFTTKDVGEGTGLGMSIVYKIIESHRGKIEMWSEPDKGTKVMLFLPLFISNK